MWGSWLDQIQKKLDDVSGLADKAINGSFDEEEEEQEQQKEKKDGVMLGKEGGQGLNSVEVAWRESSDSDVAVKERPPPPPPPPPRDYETTLPVTHDSVTEQSVLQQSTKPPALLMIHKLSDDKKIVHESSITAKEKGNNFMASPVNDVVGEHLPVERLPLPFRDSVETLSAAATLNLVTEVATTSAVTLTTNENAGQSDTALCPNGTHQLPAAGAEGEGQLLRFQQLLAEEMETSRLLREGNNRLEHTVQMLEKELSELRPLKNADDSDPQKLEALLREGMELSTQLGRERERFKLLHDKKTQLELRVTSLEKKIARFEAKEEVWKQRVTESQTECEAARRQAKELAAHLEERETDVRQLKQQLANMKSSRAEIAAQYEKELSLQKAELSLQKENILGALEALQREKESLVSSLQQSQMEYEERLRELEKKLFQANQRADGAEARLTEHERSSLEPFRELRAVLDGMERQKKQLMEEVEYLKRECSALKQSRQTDNEHFMQRLADMQSELQTMQNEKLEAEQELHHWREKHLKLQNSLDKTVERLSRTEAAKEQLEVALEEARRRADNNNTHKSNITNSSLRRGSETTRVPLPTFDVGNSKLTRSQFYFEDDGVDDGVLRGSRSRMERELVRQAVEIERYRRMEAEAAETTRKLSTLATQHDLLMQMYGQLQEELQQLQQERSSKWS